MIHFMKKAKTVDYNPIRIEKKWQKKWASSRIFQSKEDSKKKKYYVLDMFPYPSGEGLHVGHPKGYIATDILSRYMRMKGHSVLHPMGFDAFGLPAENYALKTKTNPAASVKKNVARYKKQLEILGADYDWSREVNTTDPNYYKWTQWIFLQLLKKGLAFESYEPINWCPVDKTGLANEDIENGRCERCGALVEKKPMRQWVLRITDYAERLLNDLEIENIPKFYMSKGTDAWRPGEKVTERMAVYCIVKHWQDDKYLCMKWKKNDWRGYVIGGIKVDESAVEAGIRETIEETGYKNVIFKRILGKADCHFYQELKKENRVAHATVVYLELKNEEQDSITDEEKVIQDIEWVERSKVRDFINREDLKYMWDLYTGDAKEQKLLDWPESIKTLQKNWIGRSEGALIKFKVKSEKSTIGLSPVIPAKAGIQCEKNGASDSTLDSRLRGNDKKIEVFTTRPDTLFGVTYVVLAPEHTLVQKFLEVIENKSEVEAYIAKSKNETEIQRTDETKEKTGVELKGIKVINPANNEEVPVWISDYVLADYGTGAVMAVPAHDERDWAFAKKFGLPIKFVIAPLNLNSDKVVMSTESAFIDFGSLINSEKFNDKASESVMKEITAFVGGQWVTKYKLRDWVFSRQRYWGEPIPVIHCENCSKNNPAGKGIVPVPENDLPVVLPKVKSYEPTGTGESPLAAISKWVNVKCPVCKGPAKRETNTMPQWAGSSWYYLRYMDPNNKKTLVDPKKEKYWSPVDMYVGGAEHATRHLIYARFWHKFLYDIGAVSTIEPFIKLQHVGLIMGEDGRKMSKRFGNVINPDDIVKTFGADSLRLYEMFMGPFDQQIAWSSSSIVGVRRFIEKVWKLREKIVPSKSKTSKSAPELDSIVQDSKKADRIIHKVIGKVTKDIDDLHFNTAISALMITVNELEAIESISREQYEILLKLLSPFAPHVCEELWSAIGNKKSVCVAEWPVADKSLMSDDEVKIMVQVNGKIRGSFMASVDSSDADLEAKAREVKEVKSWLEGKSVVKIIVVPKRLVNIVLA